MATQTALGAQPVEDFVFCTDCGTPHPATFKDGVGTLNWDNADDCPTTAEAVRQEVASLPENWERNLIADFADEGYVIYPCNPALMSFHRPMYYLEEK